MIVIYMMKKSQQLELKNLQQSQLYEEMNDAIIIVSRKDNTLIFSNSKAKKLLQKYVGEESNS